MVGKTHLRYSPKFGPQAGHCDFPHLMLTHSYLACTGVVEPASATCQLQQLAGARLAPKDVSNITVSNASMQQQCYPPAHFTYGLLAVLMSKQDKSGALPHGNAFLGGTLVMRLKQTPHEAYSSHVYDQNSNEQELLNAATDMRCSHCTLMTVKQHGRPNKPFHCSTSSCQQCQLCSSKTARRAC